MPGKIYIETYGCQMNEYESDRTYRLFRERRGFERAGTPDEADLVLYNTCSVRDKADQKAYSSLGHLRLLKARRPEVLIAVGGCLAQSSGREILDRAPHVDLVFGTHQWARLPELVDRAREERAQRLEIDFYGWRDYRFLRYEGSREEHPVREFVTVQNGCDKFCTFCLVPFTRGREVSRPPEEILAEVRLLVERGVREVILLGQNVNAYGRDRSGHMEFYNLLYEISTVNNLERIRFMTSHPAEMSDRLIDRMADQPKVCEHLHLPIQSGSDEVLERMNRQHTLAEYRAVVAALRERMPELSLTTDFIVGFPGETDRDFEATLAALREFRFDDSYSFRYSPRPNTKAAKWSDAVAPEVAAARLARLQELQDDIRDEAAARRLGGEVEVLVEGPSKREPGVWTGRSRTHHRVNFRGPEGLGGRLVKVRLTAWRSHTFRGEAV